MTSSVLDKIGAEIKFIFINMFLIRDKFQIRIWRLRMNEAVVFKSRKYGKIKYTNSLEICFLMILFEILDMFFDGFKVFWFTVPISSYSFLLLMVY